MNTFYAGLASMLTIESTWMPINSLKDVSENDLYHVVILKGTKSEAFFSESKDPMILNMWEKRESKIVFHTDEAIAENQILLDRSLVYVGKVFLRSVDIIRNLQIFSKLKEDFKYHKIVIIIKLNHPDKQFSFDNQNFIKGYVYGQIPTEGTNQ